MPASDFFTESFRTRYAEEALALGRFNLALFGKTGVGKSTLINAIFGSEVAETGIGRPVTQGSHLYLHTEGFLGLVDTKGLELGRDDKALLRDVDQMMKAGRKQELSEQVHVAWYCLRGLDRRFEDSEAEFIQHLHSVGLPVVVVLTQVPMRDGQYHPDAVELAHQIADRELPIVAGHPFLVQALRDQFTGQPSHGLMELLEATFQAAPEGVEGALTAAQQIDSARKARLAQAHVGAAVSAAAGAAAIPIPFSDAAVLVPIQLGMMARISQIYGIRVERAAMLALASSAAATAGGRALATNLLKFVPGAGSLVGGVVGAGVASGFTLAMGEAWLVVCQRAAAGRLPVVDGAIQSEALQALFREEFTKHLPKIRERR
ncbi:GTPase family protein [Desertihabitans aurantiacus]|uniref:GTPase family protein n=1 Tax=Desertihabitans aurantiacus TaxID=2282477 RepID=UPI000DF7A11D|nr:GTPase [Desertihabitans aurantiacus]